MNWIMRERLKISSRFSNKLNNLSFMYLKINSKMAVARDELGRAARKRGIEGQVTIILSAILE